MAPKLPMLDQMRANPRADWDINHVRTCCEQNGIDLIPPTGGSHYKAKSPLLHGHLTVPARRPIKAIYIRQLVNMIDAHLTIVRGKKDS